MDNNDISSVLSVTLLMCVVAIAILLATRISIGGNEKQGYYTEYREKLYKLVLVEEDNKSVIKE